MTNSTIAAIATPAGSGGIGIIKISGPDALLIAASVFQKQDGNKENSQSSIFNSPESHRFYYGHITDTENNRVLDEVLLAVMIAPRSYTREDVVEIHAHSGPAVLKSVLELVLSKGAKLAEPGEFTKRAYINGRIDLTQAEAVIDIISAKTDRALEIATAQVRGNMKMQIESIRDSLLHILTEAEAAIDFPDDIEDADTDALADILQKQVIDKLNSLISQYENAHFIRDGLKVVIAGRPNVGKSSLMNCLLQKDRAIVTPVPGTTRDLIEESFIIRGINVIISDTAGLHETDDIVETIGIKKTHDCIRDSDLVLFTVDMNHPLTGEDYKIYETVHHKELILVINKQDLVRDEFKFDVPASWQIPVVETSALNNEGIEALKNMIAEVCLDKCFETESAIIPNLRHKNAFEQSLKAALSAVEGIQADIPFELISIDIRESMDLLGEIIGITVREDVLEQIFSRFCIGK